MCRPPDFTGREVFQTIRGTIRSDNSQVDWRQSRSLHRLCLRCWFNQYWDGHEGKSGHQQTDRPIFRLHQGRPENGQSRLNQPSDIAIVGRGYGKAKSASAGGLLPLRLRLIDASLAKLTRPLREPASALGSFFRRCSGIDHFFDRLCGELLSPQRPAGLAGGPRWRFDLQPKLDQSADGFGAVSLVILRPLVDLDCDLSRQPNGADGVAAGSWSTALFLVYLN